MKYLEENVWYRVTRLVIDGMFDVSRYLALETFNSCLLGGY